MTSRQPVASTKLLLCKALMTCEIPDSCRISQYWKAWVPYQFEGDTGLVRPGGIPPSFVGAVDFRVVEGIEKDNEGCRV